MRNIFKIKAIALTAMLTMLTSCSSDFLDTKPESDIVSGTFTSAQDAENLLTGAYNVLGGHFQYNRFYLAEGVSDNHYVNGDNPQEWQLENFSFDPTNGVIQDAYKSLFNHIAAANAVLDNVSLINDPKWEGTTRKEQILAEAKFLRALNYYELVTQWGGVPVMTSQLNGGNLYPARNTVSEVYALIIEDLKFAESVLNYTAANNQYGRATKGAAEALLAKTYAQMGDYANCLTYTNKVINDGPYSLVSNYANLWGSGNKNNSESIFEIQQGGGGGWWGFEIFTRGTSEFPKRNICSADLINVFSTNGDNGARYQSTVNFQTTTASFNMPVNAWNSTQPIPFINKYNPNNSFSQDNIKVIRLTDIILLAAEANVQLVKAGSGGSLTNAKTLLDQIRNRAGIANSTAVTTNELALAVLNERRIELVFECTRWNDLKRADANGTINIVNVMNNQKDSHGLGLGYTIAADKHQLIFPIPQQDRELNKNLTQNLGYTPQ